MIAEVITWLTTRCAPQARQLGYLYEAIAMQSRLKRCQHAWQSHLLDAQTFITRCMEQQPKGGVVLILGSGLGVDLPKEALLAHFDEIWLVDMVHLRTARAAWKNDAKVKFMVHDVTESLDDLVQGDLTVNMPTQWLGKTDIRLVVSANILGQLPILPMSWLVGQKIIDERLLETWARKLLQSHLDYLNAFRQQGSQVCLVADMEWRHAEGNQVREVIDAWRGLDQPEPDAQWAWRVAPRGEFSANRTQTNWVGGWCFAPFEARASV